MKKLSFRLLFMTMVAGLLFTSCEDDGTGGGGSSADAPSITLTGSDVTAAPGDTVFVTIAAVEGDSPINSLSVTENGVNVPLDRVVIDGTAASSNPILILDPSEKISFTREVGVIIPDDGSTVITYSYVVTDEDMNASSEDIFVTILAEPPSFEILGDGDIQLAPESIGAFTVQGMSNGVDMNTISVTIDSEPVADFDFAGVTVSNPHTLDSMSRESFETQIRLRAPSTGGSYTVEVTVTDNAGQTASDQIIFVVGTTAAEYFDRVFFNAVGSQNGAIDLDTGENVSSSSSESELQDDGIDDQVDPTEEENWFASFSPENGATLYLIEPGERGLTESFTFEGVQFQEEVEALRMNGLELTSSGTVSPGEIYLVTRDTNTYLILIDEVNAVFGSNDDNYVIDIKLGQ